MSRPSSNSTTWLSRTLPMVIVIVNTSPTARTRWPVVRFRQVVVAIPSWLQRWIGDEFEDLVRRRRDLAARADDLGSLAVHNPIQQHLDSDKLRVHSRRWNLSLPRSSTGGLHDRTSRHVCSSRRSRPRDGPPTSWARRCRRATSRWTSTRTGCRPRSPLTPPPSCANSSPTCRSRSFVATIRSARPHDGAPHGSACASTSAPTWRWSSSCSRCGWRSASRQAPGTSGRSGRSSARASASSATRYRFASRYSPVPASRLDQPARIA